jgi:hypothetical protein
MRYNNRKTGCGGDFRSDAEVQFHGIPQRRFLLVK